MDISQWQSQGYPNGKRRDISNKTNPPPSYLSSDQKIPSLMMLVVFQKIFRDIQIYPYISVNIGIYHDGNPRDIRISHR